MRKKVFMAHTASLGGGGGMGEVEGGGGGGGVAPCVPLPWYSTDKIDN